MKVFTDLDQFAEAIGGIDGRFVPLAAPEAHWAIVGRRLPRLSVQQVQVGSAAVFAGHGHEGQLTVGIPTSDPGAININGEALDPRTFVLNRYSSPLIYSAKSPTTWLTVTLTGATDQYSNDLVEIASKPPRPQQHGDPGTLRRIGLLVRWFCRDHDFAGGLEQQAVAAAEEDLIGAVSALLSPRDDEKRHALGRPRIARERLIGRCLQFLRDNESQPVLITDLCRAAHVSERTLRNSFIEYFGVGPRRFLNAHQLHQIRRTLLASQEQSDHVSAIAARFGVWDFSAFSRNYRRMYGESPSETLREIRFQQPVGREATDSPASWMSFAAQCFREGSTARAAE